MWDRIRATYVSMSPSREKMMYHGMRKEIPGHEPRNQDEHREPLLPEARDGVGGGKAQQERRGNRDRADDRGVQEVLREVLLREDPHVVRQDRGEGEKARRGGDDVDLALERRGEHPEEREQDDQGHEHDQDGGNDAARAPPPQLSPFFMRPRHSPSPF